MNQKPKTLVWESRRSGLNPNEFFHVAKIGEDLIFESYQIHKTRRGYCVTPPGKSLVYAFSRRKTLEKAKEAAQKHYDKASLEAGKGGATQHE